MTKDSFAMLILMLLGGSQSAREVIFRIPESFSATES